jgi:DNA-binding response OmpR family regulator
MSDQRPAAVLWSLTLVWAMFVWYWRFSKAWKLHPLQVVGNTYGGLTFSETESRFYAADGEAVQLTPMQHQLLQMFFQSPAHSLTKTEICDALWPKKPDASDTLYTLIRRLKPVIEQHSDLRIESDRGKAYSLKMK